MIIWDSSSSYKIDFVKVINNFQNLKGYQNPIAGSKVTAIILKGWIWPIGGVASGRVCFLMDLPFNLGESAKFSKIAPPGHKKDAASGQNMTAVDTNTTPMDTNTTPMDIHRAPMDTNSTNTTCLWQIKLHKKMFNCYFPHTWRDSVSPLCWSEETEINRFKPV